MPIKLYSFTKVALNFLGYGMVASSERAFPQLLLERSFLSRRQLRWATSRYAMLEPSEATAAIAFGPLTDGRATDAKSRRNLRL